MFPEGNHGPEGCNRSRFRSGRTQFTSAAFVSRFLDRSVAVSMDGRGRALDNVFIERPHQALDNLTPAKVYGGDTTPREPWERSDS